MFEQFLVLYVFRNYFPQMTLRVKAIIFNQENYYAHMLYFNAE